MGGSKKGKGGGKPTNGENGSFGDFEPIVVPKTSEELPIYAHKEAILQHIREHRITHIQGETGCGKSTQVPKYIMEEAENLRKSGQSDGVTKIVVTQPRRMAAITLARRVASELGEEIGNTVGYKISGDSVAGKLCFVTTGFLLQVLVNQPEEFATYTHVILDEVHERSVDADLLTMLMKLLMQCSPKVRLIVMSATLQAHLFAQYFSVVEEGSLGRPRRGYKGGYPSLPEVKPIFVGVRTYPVQEIFLDELDDHFEIRGGFARQGLDKALTEFWRLGGGSKGKGGKGKGKSKDTGSASGFKRLEPQIAQGFDELCKELVMQMAREKCTLIVFLPGIADITSFYECMAPLDRARGEVREQQRQSASDRENWRTGEVMTDSTTDKPSNGEVSLRIYPMHSLIPREEQEEVFNAPPAGVCHVVLASNIAESSLTLPSVCGIIDLAMRRSIQYDARRLMSCLVTTWCSQSSCKQRAGRAGRTMPGRAVRLVPRGFFQQEMVEFDPPEMLNAPLTKLYLQAKQLCSKLDNMYGKGLIPEDIDMNLSTPTHLLGEVVQPPSTSLVTAAIQELADVGCIDCPQEDASITPLGFIAMALPCELRLCRLLYLGLMMKCPCDAIAMVAGLTAADPFSAPSLLVIKDQLEYVTKLKRSFEARQWCDLGRHSEPLMLRDLFKHWIEAGAPRGPKQMGPFARHWNIIPKKFEAMASEAVDLCQRIVKLLAPRSEGFVSVQRLLASMRFNVDRREELVKANFPQDHEYRKIFCEDVNKMRALLCAGFSDQLLVHLKPKWAPVKGGKKKKEEVMVDIMTKQRLNYRGTVCLLNPPNELRGYNSEENHSRLAEAMCGARPKRIHWDDKEKLLFLDFKDAPPQRGKKGVYTLEEDELEEASPDAVILDVCPEAHRLHQFGAGRWKFSVELQRVEDEAGDDDEWGGRREGSYEILKPLQPFLLNWEVVQHVSSSSGGGGKGGGKGAKKTSVVKAMPDWRNPCGFACHAAGTLPPEEQLGICASVQGLESGASAFVAGTTILGLNYVPLLLTTLDPRKWQVQWGFDDLGQVVALKIMQYELYLPPDTFTADVIYKVNEVRKAILEALTPWEEEEEESKDWRGNNNRNRGSFHIWVGDLSSAMDELLEEIWDVEPVRPPQRVYWQSAGEEPDESLPHHWLQPMTEEIDWDQWTWENQPQQSSKKQKNPPTKKADAGGAAMDKIIQWLKKRPKGVDKLSSVCGRFKVKSKVLRGHPELGVEMNGQDGLVWLRYGGGREQQGRKNGKGGGGGGGGGGKGASKGSGKSAYSSNAAGMDRRIRELCTGNMPCRPDDFDKRVRSTLSSIERHRGPDGGRGAFEMLQEWIPKKQRDDVSSWPKYLTVLLQRWEKDVYGEHEVPRRS
mmetsp:Transcript_75920/g.165608  ORF Transcript_75920/g.165608 Transcript_75920/m.165608 type:complete len:1381 (-) Transcript_75920:60-4202(-)